MEQSISPQGPARTVPSFKLALLMFFQLFSQGAFAPVLSMYLRQYLHFSGSQTGLILACSVITSLLAPVFALYIIDRLLSSRMLLVVSHAGMAILAVLLSQVRDFPLFICLYVLYMALGGPTMGLVNALSFQHVKGGSRSFGNLRVFGTLGWIAAGWLISLCWMLLPLCLGGKGSDWYPLVWAISSAGSLVTISSALGMPPGAKKSQGQEKKAFIPPQTRAIFKKPEILILCLVYLLSSILDRFYTFGTAPYLLALGIPQAWVMPVMTLGQISEVFTLFTLVLALRRFGYRKLMLAGMVIQVLRFALYAGGNLPLALAGVSLNGFIFAWLYTSITMYIDEHTSQAERAGVHQILVFVFSGISSLLGNIGAGILNDRAPQSSLEGWKSFWLVPTLAGLGILVLMVLFFLRSKRKSSS